MAGPPESPERTLLRRLLKQSRATVISVATDGSGVLRLGAMVVISSAEAQLVTELLR